MAITKLTSELNYISDLGNTPGLAPETLKQKFDQAGIDIQNYINNVLIRDLESSTYLVDSLSSTSTTKGLTANQGKVLKDSMPVVLDSLGSSSTSSALSANQGKVLNAKIPAVLDSLTSTSTSSALSAKQGKALNEKIPSVINSLTSTSTTGALSANQGTVLKGLVDGKQKTITYGTAAPSGGSNGDVYLRY